MIPPHMIYCIEHWYDLYAFDMQSYERPYRNSQIYRYQRQIWGKVSFTWEHLWYTPPAHCHDNNSYNFSDFQLYQVTLLIDPPISTLKQKLEMVYSFTFYTALYIYLLSLYELCHLELSKWTGQSCICFYAKFLWFYHVVLLLLLLLLCISPQHIYVVVVVVVVVLLYYYTSGTRTTK